jgi:hypothetical protein
MGMTDTSSIAGAAPATACCNKPGNETGEELSQHVGKALPTNDFSRLRAAVDARREFLRQLRDPLDNPRRNHVAVNVDPHRKRAMR